MSIKHILFDLDGTLLPMHQDEFVSFYLPMLAKRFVDKGIDPKDLIAAVWKGFRAMVMNDGKETNEEVFWKNFREDIEISREEMSERTLSFYAEEFNEAICTTKPSETSAKIIEACKEKGIQVYLATNPVFPRVATMNRVKWAGLNAEDFKIITTYETCCYSKPSPEYYKQILDEFHIDPQECLMVGNDVVEDTSIAKWGVKTFLITDYLENKKNLPIESDYQGSLEDCLAFIKRL